MQNVFTIAAYIVVFTVILLVSAFLVRKNHPLLKDEKNPESVEAKDKKSESR